MLTTGDFAGHYEILGKLGEGGMGVVYKARDKRLDRLVALKVLPADKSGDEERIRRFTQEARAASALNHPNIVTIYEIASEDSTRFIVMEYVPGKPLDELIPRKGMRLNEALKIAIQIADAVTAAAAAGIVHRDLKPANVMITDSGFVKVLDFGLAKLAEPSDSEQTAALTVEEERPRTREGTVLGTSSYMSPEQTEGKPLDPRSDIFSFGAVLYEMITGQRAFRGETNMSTLSAILREEPKPASQISADIPRELDRVIARCLRKDRERRFQHMADVRIALLELKEESESGKLPGYEIPRRSRRRSWLWAGLAGALVIAAAAFAIRLRTPSSGPEPHVVPLTSYTGYQGQPAFSPDGNEIAFVWAEHVQDHRHIFVKVIGTDTPLRLTSTDKDDGSPAWAPEGQSIAFIRKLSDAASAVYTVSPLGGGERRVAEIGPLNSVNYGWSSPGLSWSSDGKWLVTSGRQTPGGPARILAVSADTGEIRVLDFGGTVDEVGPVLSPDSHTLAFCRVRGEAGIDIYTARLSDDLRPKSIPRRLDISGQFNSWPAWTPDGSEVVFARRGDTGGTARLWRVAANGTGPARPIEGIGEGVSAPAVASHKNRLALQHAFLDPNIWQIPTSGTPASARPRVLIASTRPDVVRPNAFSPDGRKIVFESSRSGPLSVWSANADGSSPTFLYGVTGYLSGSPVWSPDGKWIAFDSRKDGPAQIYAISADGGAPRRITHDQVDDMVPAWSHDGKWIYFDSRRGERFEIFKIPPGGGTAIVVTHNGAWAPQESADGRFIYYSRLREGVSPLFRMPIEGGPEVQILPAVSPRGWTLAERGIWFRQSTPNGEELQFMDFGSSKTRTVAQLNNIYSAPGLALSPDQHTLLYNQVDSFGTEILLVENFR